MVNSQLINEVVNVLKLDSRVENIPSVVMTAETNPKVVTPATVASASLIISGGGIVYTVPNTQDFYLRSINFGMIKDATCDKASGNVTVTGRVNGITVTLASLPVLVSTAQTNQCTVLFQNPVKIDRGGTINIGSATYTTGLMSRTVDISGFLDEIN